jgi:quaternary ammonium compound-resistance protein SugE
MEWIWLLLAGLMEIVWALGLKYTEGFTKLWASLGTIVVMGVSFFLLSLALERIPIGTAYAVWTGIGAVGVAIVGIIYFNEPSNAIRLICIALIVAGIIGLKFTSHAAV